MKNSKEYEVILLPNAERIYRKLFHSDQSHFKRIANSLESLKSEPFQGKALKHKLKGKYSLRVGTYRVIYSVEKQKITVYIFEIGHRRDVYN